MPPTLQERLKDQPYQGYAYAYPHKTAYRHFDTPIPLSELWHEEDKSNLYLYVHLPFCEMRCGFCNLFTTTNPKDNVVSNYLQALDLQLQCTGEALGENAQFSRGAFGGGTPSFLSITELELMFGSINRHLGKIQPAVPMSFELSPATVVPEKLAFLKSQGITRFSIGVQSFLPSETKEMGRPQSLPEVHNALRLIRETNAPVMNIDLIYGAESQTIASWQSSIREALEYKPEELYLYPLYVRPLTGLEKIGRTPADHRLDLYRAGRDFLRESGYQQVSMRLFRRQNGPGELNNQEGPVYCCQEDGMVGIGAGARSYTRSVHYCTEYAVGKTGINQIIADYSERSRKEHSHAVYGCHLSAEEQKRRYVLKSLLRIEGISKTDYKRNFTRDVFEDFPDLYQLIELQLATNTEGMITLTDYGFEHSDTIGPWLFSADVVSNMNSFDLM